MPACVAKVGVHRRAVVAGVALLDAKAVGQEGVPSRRIHQKAGVPPLLCAIVQARCHTDAAIVLEDDPRRLAAFVHLCTKPGCVAQQDLIKLGPLDLVGMGHGLVPGFGEVEGLRMVMVRGDELGARLVHADGPYLVGHTQAFEQGQVGRQQRLPDVEPGVPVLVKHHHLVATFGQQ